VVVCGPCFRAHVSNSTGQFPEREWGPGLQTVQELVNRLGGEQGSRAPGFFSGNHAPLLRFGSATYQIELPKGYRSGLESILQL
jgi:hypothetical protein